jgi:hypothetical protein
VWKEPFASSAKVFFAARPFADLDDLNAQAALWCQTQAAQRPCPEDRSRRVAEVFEEEKPRLLSLPDDPFPCEDRFETRVGRSPYVRFDLNDYSVPHTYVRRPVVVLATLQTVRIVVDAATVIATHARSFSKGEQIEKAEHIQALVDFKRSAGHHRGLDRLHHACAHAAAFFTAVAERSGNLGATTTGLTRLLDLYGAAELDAALAAALASHAPHLAAVRQLLEQKRHAGKQPPPVAVALPPDPRVRDIVVEPHDLATYDQVQKEPTDDDDN